MTKVKTLSDLDEAERIENQGHTYHCAARQVWGDGQCECKRDKLTDMDAHGIAMLRTNCPSFLKYESHLKQVVEDMISCMNIAVYRMRNAESVKEADDAYMDVLKATARLVKELPANKEIL